MKPKANISIEFQASNVTIGFDHGHDIFRVKYGICYISAKNDPIATKQNMNISIEHLASNVAICFDLGHDLNFDFQGEIFE